MSYSYQYIDYEFIAFWSKEVIELIRELKKVHAKNSTTQHDLALRFVNDRLFEGKGTLIKGKPIKDQKYSGLKVFLNATRNSITIEFKLRTSVLKYLQEELRDKEDLFSRNDYLYFSYFLQRKSKDKTKILKVYDCMYYLVVITFSKKVRGIDLKELVNKAKQDAKDFTEKVANESGVDFEEEELLGVENIIKVVDLERENQAKDKIIEEKEKTIEEKEKTIEEKDKIIEKLREENKKLKTIAKVKK